MKRPVLLSLIIGAITAVGCGGPEDLGSWEETTYLDEPAGADAIIDGGFHRDDVNDYSIHLPAEWEPIDASALRAQSEAVSGPSLRIDYVAGYQVAAHDALAHPLILVRRLPASTLPREKIGEIRREYA